LSKWDVAFWLLYFLAGGLPHLIIFVSEPSKTCIDPAYLSGLITASGILLGFISTTALTKSKTLPYDIMFVITVDFAVFFLAIFKLFLSILYGNPSKINVLAWIMSSFLVNGGTVYILMSRLRTQRL